MTGREFLKLSAVEVRDWLDKHAPGEIRQVLPAHWIRKRKILKFPTMEVRSHGDNDLEFIEIRIRFGDKYTILNTERIDGKKDITWQVKVYRGTHLISQYVRP